MQEEHAKHNRQKHGEKQLCERTEKGYKWKRPNASEASGGFTLLSFEADEGSDAESDMKSKRPRTVHLFNNGPST